MTQQGHFVGKSLVLLCIALGCSSEPEGRPGATSRDGHSTGGLTVSSGGAAAMGGDSGASAGMTGSGGAAALGTELGPVFFPEGIVFDVPLVITKGGTYTGAFRSSSADVPAVAIRTTEPVILENCLLEGPGHLIDPRNADGSIHVGVDVTVRDCFARGVDPMLSGRARGRFFNGVWSRRVVLENNYIEHTRGVLVNSAGQNPRDIQEVTIVRNRFREVDGRVSGIPANCDGALNDEAGRSENGHCRCSAVQLNGTRGAKVEVVRNEVINHEGSSHSEDIINLFNVVGTATERVLVSENLIWGSYPENPSTDTHYGAGINLDSSASSGWDVPQYIDVDDNHVISVANVGIGVAIGVHNRLRNNHIVSSGFTASGLAMPTPNAGLALVNCYGAGIDRYSDNRAEGNSVGRFHVPSGKRYDYRSSDSCAGQTLEQDILGLGASNSSLPGAISKELEQDEYRVFVAKMVKAGVELGPRKR